MKKLAFTSTPSLATLAHKAAKAWNEALTFQAIIPAENAKMCQERVYIGYGTVNRTRDPGRVAEHTIFHSTGTHFITLEQSVRWRITRWQRWLGLGDQDAYAALLHEFGHALGLPHSDRFSDVMHAELGSTVISEDEALRYRRFLANQEPRTKN